MPRSVLTPTNVAFFLTALAFLAACASGGVSVPTVDAGRGDAGAPDAALVDARVGCASGEHMCPGGCERDRDDDPAMGCRLGCGSAPCTAPEGGRPTCSAAGTCDFECVAPYVRAGEGCACTPRTCDDLGAMCGTPDDGCGGTLSCGGCGPSAMCASGRCVCTPDAGEPNDAEARAITLGATNDADDGPTITRTDFNADDALDVDFFAVAVTDGFDGGNPALTVTLDGMPGGTNLDLVVWYRCTAGGDAHTCATGTAYDGPGGPGCSSTLSGTSTETVVVETECSTTDESGRLIVRVATSGFGMCGNYRLVVQTR